MSKADERQKRVEIFAVEVVKMCRTFPCSVETQRIIPQLIGAATSLGANYRAARRGRSKALTTSVDFTKKRWN